MQTLFQFSSSDTWVVNHNYGYYPVTEVIVLLDGVYQTILPEDVVMNSENQLTITFTAPRAGFVRLK